MKQVLRVAAIICLTGFLTSCEWDTVEDAQAWNDSQYSWVNFNGTYRAVFGGVIVANWTRTPGTQETDVPSVGEVVGTGTATQTFYGGVFGNRPVVSGSVSILADGFGFTDAGNGTLVGSVAGTAGTISYATGAWSIDLGAGTITVGSSITASYLYTVGGTQGQVEPGSSQAVYTLTIQQLGNMLTIIDSNGKTFTGQMGVISRTAATNPLDLGGVVVVQFEASGQAYGQMVRMVGTLQGTVNAIDTDTANTFFDRQIQGTWIESGGMTGDILGGAPNVTVHMPDAQFDTRPTGSASNTTVYTL